ncbi:hypothetical protein AB4226_01410 [Vibrio artabrorum]|uniref:hypothetical protein n=1 Tax=Vibrio artabrorum TaxID=446374 RepID=UPI003553FE1C
MKTTKEESAYAQIINALDELNDFQVKSLLNLVTKKYGYERKVTKRRQLYRSKIDLDPELKLFILSMNLEDLMKSEVLAKCITKFGKERSPSYTALCRSFPKLLDEKRERNN